MDAAPLQAETKVYTQAEFEALQAQIRFLQEEKFQKELEVESESDDEVGGSEYEPQQYDSVGVPPYKPGNRSSIAIARENALRGIGGTGKWICRFCGMDLPSRHFAGPGRDRNGPPTQGLRQLGQHVHVVQGPWVSHNNVGTSDGNGQHSGAPTSGSEQPSLVRN